MSTSRALSYNFSKKIKNVLRSERALAYLFLLPTLIMIFAFVIIPAIWGLWVSFTPLSLVGKYAMKYDFIGLKNYIKLISDADFYNSIKISFIFTILSALIGQAFLGLMLALVMREKAIKGKSIVAITVFLAWIIPEVVAGYMWGVFASREGMMNTLLALLGMPPRNWLYDLPLETIIIANIWRGTAFSMILFMAALEGIPHYIYEAAEIDGASWWQRFRYIILPMMAYVILVDFILITIWTFNVFTMIFVMTGGGPGNATELWTIFVYRRAFQPPYEVGYASAAANLMFLIVFLIILSYIYVSKKLRWYG